MSKPQKTSPIDVQKFWERVKISSKDKCWLWMKSRTSTGYGHFYVHPKVVLAHRTAWELTNGKIPRGMNVCHHCDNPPCCNPRHLFLGTMRDNIRDAYAKGRMNNHPVRGTSHPFAKLTEYEVAQIKRLYRPGTPGKSSDVSVKGLAKMYGVAHSLIHRIVTGQSWPHVTAP